MGVKLFRLCITSKKPSIIVRKQTRVFDEFGVTFIFLDNIVEVPNFLLISLYNIGLSPKRFVLKQ